MRLSEKTKKRRAGNSGDVSYSKVFLFFAKRKQKIIKTILKFQCLTITLTMQHMKTQCR